jgi:membrane-associated phospholipid phosphatase
VTLAPVVPRLIAIAVLAVTFVAMTMAITAGTFGGLDQQVALAMHSAWQPSLHALFQAIAELGGIELSGILTLGLLVYLVRGGFGADAWVVVAPAVATVLEVVYKSFLHHPEPPALLAQNDGPSFSALFGESSVGNSFPSGHVVRSVIVFGLIAFVIRRLSTSKLVRGLTLLGAVLVIALVAFDRLYLDVHWESDVIGGLLLGAIALLAGTVWLDRPRTRDH